MHARLSGTRQARTRPGNGPLAAAGPDSTLSPPDCGGLIALDTTVTAELAREGTARDVVRVIQQARKDAGLDVSDRIRLVVGADGAGAEAVTGHLEFIAGETLAVEVPVVLGAALPTETTAAAEPQPVGGEVRVQVTRT